MVFRVFCSPNYFLASVSAFASFRRSSFLLCSAALLVAGIFGACGESDTNTDAEVVNPRLLQAQDGQRIFAGTLVNQGSSTIGIAEVEVALYDNEGSRIETMRIQVQDVPPSDSTGFKQTIDSDRPIQQAQVQQILIP